MRLGLAWGAENMDDSFDADAFIRRIGERLVDEFSDARAGTTPSTVGSAAEKPVRKQLEQTLPRGLGVGQGFVIDSYGGTSRQQDVIIYERDICPVFSVNATPDTTYYPCEGVVAVGEIKSSLDRNSLENALTKSASVKVLQRHLVPDQAPHPRTGEPMPVKRNYLSPHGGSIRVIDDGPERKERNEVFAFILAGKSRLKRATLVSAFRELSAGKANGLVPNLVVTLDGLAVSWGKVAKNIRREVHKTPNGSYGVTLLQDGPERWQPTQSAITATHAGASVVPDPFRFLVRWIRQTVESGETSDVSAFDRYFEEKGEKAPEGVFAVPKQSAPE